MSHSSIFECIKLRDLHEVSHSSLTSEIFINFINISLFFSHFQHNYFIVVQVDYLGVEVLAVDFCQA